MSDIDLESLKSLFENLADRLDETSGDDTSAAGLNGVRDAVRDLIKEMKAQESTAAVKRTAHEYVKEFFEAWQKIDPMKDVEKAIEDGNRGGGGNGTPGDGTILDELRKGGGGVKKGRDDLQRDMGIFGKNIKEKGQVFGGALGKTTGKLALLSAAVGGATTLTKGAIAWGTQQVDSYRDVVNSAEGSIGSIQQLASVAGNAGMSVADLANAMKTGSDGARQLGAVGFAKLNDSVRRATRDTGLMGLTFGQLSEVTSDYLDIQKNAGNLNDGVSVEKMTAGIQKLVKSADITAGILGQTRQEALAAIKERSRDANLQASANAQGLDSDKLAAALNTANGLGGPGAEAALKDLIMTGGAGYVNKDAANAIAVTPGLDEATRKLFSDLKNKNDNAENTYGQALKKLGNDEAANKGLSQVKAFLGAQGIDGFTTASTIATKGRTGKDISDEKYNKGTEQKDQGTVALLNVEDIAKRFEANLQLAISKPMTAVMNEFGGQMMDAAHSAYNLSDSLTKAANSLDGHESATSKMTVGILGVVGALTVFGTVMNTLSAAKGIGGLVKGAFGGGGARGAQGAARAGGTVLEELAGKGAGKTSFLSKLFGGGARAAGATEGLAGATAARGGAALLGGAAAGVGGLIGVGLSDKMVRDNKGESFFGQKAGEGGVLSSRAGGYAGAAASGALAGAGIGAFFGGVGAVPGAAIGAGVGAGSAYITDNWDNITGALSGKKKNTANANTLGSQNTAGNETKPAKSPIDNMTEKLSGLQASSNVYLKHLVENSNRQLEIARDELSVARTYYEKMTKTQEETVRAIRTSSNSF